VTDLAQLLEVYRQLWVRPESPWSAKDQDTVSRMQEFLVSSDQVFQRSHRPGHFTGSALICNARLEKVALTHHRKLEKWLQFGGHADGDCNLARVALRECEEESGLVRLTYLDFEEALGCPYHPIPFDLDIHQIPARGQDPEHLHYDVRFLLWSEESALQGNHESREVAWFSLCQARQHTQEDSMLRQFAKLELLRKSLSALRSVEV